MVMISVNFSKLSDMHFNVSYWSLLTAFYKTNTFFLNKAEEYTGLICGNIMYASKDDK